MSVRPFPVTPELTAIAIAYRNERLIADDVLPRVPVGRKDFRWRKYALADSFTLADTTVGRKSQPNQVEFGFTEETDSAVDYGLDDTIPNDDIQQAPPNYNPEGRAVEMIMQLIALDREVRAANLIFNASSYATANKVTLSGTSQWSDFTNSDPIAAIQSGMDSMIMRGNIMVIGRVAFSSLVRHPKIVKAANRNQGDSGIVRRQDLAELLELDDVIVGEGWLNTAKKGQTPTMTRVWGKHAAILYRDRTASTTSGLTFGYTVQTGTRVAGSIPEPKVGLRGSVLVRAGETVKEIIAANDLGYFFQNAVA